MKWTLKEKREFVRLRKKKRAFEVYDPKESHKLEIYLGTSLAWSLISHNYAELLL